MIALDRYISFDPQRQNLQNDGGEEHREDNGEENLDEMEFPLNIDNE